MFRSKITFRAGRSSEAPSVLLLQKFYPERAARQNRCLKNQLSLLEILISFTNMLKLGTDKNLFLYKYVTVELTFRINALV
jgi:hypothetical protein